MKIATWNVNGIRKRQTELQDWLDRDQPDIVCLQEIKADVDQLPVWLCEIEGYWCYWHGGKGYSGVGLHVSKRLSPRAPCVRTPDIRLREPDRPGAAACGDGRVGVRAERREGLPGEDAVPRCARAIRRGHAARCRARRDLRRPEHRAHRHGRAPEGAEAPRDRPASGGARAARTDHRSRARGRGPWRWSRTTIRCSRGGRRGGTCGSETSAGASTTCLRASALFDRVRSCTVERETGTSDHAPVVGRVRPLNRLIPNH